MSEDMWDQPTGPQPSLGGIMAAGLNWTHDADTLTRLRLVVGYRRGEEQRRLRWWRSRRRYRELCHGVAVLDDIHSELSTVGTLTIPPIGLGDLP